MAAEAQLMHGGHRAGEYPWGVEVRVAEVTLRKAHWAGAGVEVGQSP